VRKDFSCLLIFTVDREHQPGVLVVLRLEGFGIVTIVGCDPEAARVGDIEVEIVHSGFHTRAEVWVKARNGPSGWVSTSRM